jgi:hypothetical protein
MWSSGQSSWLQIERSGFESRLYQIFLEVVGLERDPLSLMSTIEELLERKSSGSKGFVTLTTWHPQKPALTSPISGGRSVGIDRSRSQATEFVLFVYIIL